MNLLKKLFESLAKKQNHASPVQHENAAPVRTEYVYVPVPVPTPAAPVSTGRNTDNKCIPNEQEAVKLETAGQFSEILLRRKNKLNIAPYSGSLEGGGNVEKAMVISIAKNIESLGFTFSKELIEVLQTYPKDDITQIYRQLIPVLRSLVGADKEYRPMYPNFPQQVMDASDAELYINAIIHYLTFGQWQPEYEKDNRMPLFDTVNMKVLSVGDHEDLMEIFSNLVSSKTSLSDRDKVDVATMIAVYPDFYNYLPDEIPLKENVALIALLITGKAAVKDAAAIQKYFKTATDVLRFITALSDGDISLAQDTKYRSLRRCERRMVMDLLAGCGNILEDMYRYQYEWIRIGEIVHPSEFKAKKYEMVNKAFHTLRNEHKPLFLPGKIQAAISEKNMAEAAAMLKKRPGEFARGLDKLLREAEDPMHIVDCFAEVAPGVSTPVLLQVRQHFMNRNTGNPVRVFFPKGKLAKAIVVKNDLPVIDDKVCKAVADICEQALIGYFRDRAPMGKVYIDPAMENILVPFSQRSASNTSKILVRGSKIPIRKDARAVRGFIWWTNMGSRRVDIDLSAAMYDEHWNYITHVSYTRLRSEDMSAYHSGDITNGGSPNGKGVTEFLDVSVDAIAKQGRYVVYQVYNFTDQKFSNLPNCRFGWMEREDVGSGEIFEPSTVEMSMDLTAESKVAIPVIFDCWQRKFIWCDMNLGIDSTQTHCHGNNLESNLSGVSATCYGMTHLNKATIYDLVMLNAKARGEITEDRNEADIIFSNDTTLPVETIETKDEKTGVVKAESREKKSVRIVTAFDVDYFMGQLL